MHNKHNRVKKTNLLDGFWIPTAAAVGIIPLITGVYFYTNDVLAGYPWFLPSSYYSADVFLAYKSFAVQVLMAVMVLAFVYRVLKTKEKPCMDRSFLLFIPYLFFVVLSGACSQYPALSFGISYDRFEPVGVVVSYAVICIYSYLFIDSENRLKKVIFLCSVSFALMMIIGVLQGLGADPFNTEFMSRLLTPGSMSDGAGQITVMRYGKVAYCTLYNENYTGVYLAVLLPICVMIASLRINKGLRAAAGVLAAASLFVLYRSGSMSAAAALTVSVFAVLMLRLYRKKGVKALAAAAALIIAGVLAVLIVPSLRVRFMENVSGKDRYPYGRIIDIDTGDDEVVFFFYSGNELHCRFDFTDDGEIRPEFWDKEGRTLKASYDDGAYRLDECFEYANAAVKGEPTGQPGVYVASFVIDDHQWPITNCTDGTYYYVTSGLKLVKYPKINSAGLFPDEFLSGRGAIWNRSIPMLKKHLLLGCGSNLFITDYQQDDYARKTYSVGWGSFEYDVKPHSYYICTWMESGFLALLCIIAFFLYYIISGARLYGRIDLNDEISVYGPRIGLGMYIGCTAYMIIVAANDSIVCTAPVFWGVLGMSMALNKRLKGQDSGQGHKDKR